MLSMTLEILFTVTIGAGVWIAAGLGPALIVAGTIALVLVEIYGLELGPDQEDEDEGTSF